MVLIDLSMNNVLLEVPLNAGIRNIIDYASEGCDMVVYDSFSYSPLNGGRNNHSLIKSDEELKDFFYNSSSELNANNIPFYLVYTNFFCDDDELASKDVLAPLDFLANSSCKNGVIVTNPKLEVFLRETYGDSLTYVSSCQRVFLEEEMLSLEGRVESYKRDLDKFDYVVLAPHDSESLDAIDLIPQDQRGKLVSIINTPCQPHCNSYWHYLQTSLLNKLNSTHNGLRRDFYSSILGRVDTNISQCLSMCNIEPNGSILSKEMIRNMIESGVSTFKIGRGKTDGDDDIADMMDFYQDLYDFTCDF